MNAKKTIGILIHIISWILILWMPFYLSQRNKNPDSFMTFCGLFIFFIATFYINYFILIDKFLFSKKIILYILINLVMITGFSLLSYEWFEYRIGMDPQFNGPRHPQETIFIKIFKHFISFLLTAGLALAVKQTKNWYILESQRKVFEKEKIEAELQHLKYQLNPHFLFNTLNNIYSLTMLDIKKTQNAILELSNLLRYVLNQGNLESVDIEKELNFTKDYIHLMQLRLNNNVDLQVCIPENIKTPYFQISPLLLISLIENAFKHGIHSEEKSFIHISIEISENGHLICHVSNSNFPKDKDDKSGSGIGLNNLKKRLELLYPNHYQFTTTISNCCYSSTLQLDLKSKS